MPSLSPSLSGHSSAGLYSPTYRPISCWGSHSLFAKNLLEFQQHPPSLLPTLRHRMVTSSLLMLILVLTTPAISLNCVCTSENSFFIKAVLSILPLSFRDHKPLKDNTKYKIFLPAASFIFQLLCLALKMQDSGASLSGSRNTLKSIFSLEYPCL